MKYLSIIFLWLLASLFFAWFNVNNWHWLQPFLIATIFLYLINDNPWIYYIFAAVSGFFIDAYSATFGMHMLSFLLVILVISNLQILVFTSKNTGTVILLTMFGVVTFWLTVWLLHFIPPWSVYIFNIATWQEILKFYFINIFLTFFIYILYFNLKIKRHELR